ncbi:MAG TPA: prepilin-type N-terminal cleavage/methylation domain-containing protein [Usitatibacter sp.]|jgi:prepilin-type N-terminal cleavage/methylation domain-containing protein|nr:prepilin-type N-terminal cleavage/methylation domain-containing protein [Usitatibacter sp.]
MRRQQSGFTLVEIAIVLVIIGLLLGGILKGQELINSAKVKNLANDFRVIPTYIYAYQDKFRSLPGDDTQATTHINCGTGSSACANGNGNGVIDGNWDASTGESFQFWQQVRYANLAAGPTATDDPTYLPQNAVGGKLGITSATTTQTVAGITGTYVVCSSGVLGKFAKQLDIQMDDGNTATGSMRTVGDGSGTLVDNAGAAVPTASIDDSKTYQVCMGF